MIFNFAHQEDNSDVNFATIFAFVLPLLSGAVFLMAVFTSGTAPSTVIRVVSTHNVRATNFGTRNAWGVVTANGDKAYTTVETAVGDLVFVQTSQAYHALNSGIVTREGADSNGSFTYKIRGVNKDGAVLTVTYVVPKPADNAKPTVTTPIHGKISFDPLLTEQDLD